MANKIWKNIAHFDTFAEADKYRNELIGKHNLIKVKRGANTFRVKVWDPPPSENKKPNKRPRKNGNKKIRTRQKQT